MSVDPVFRSSSHSSSGVPRNSSSNAPTKFKSPNLYSNGNSTSNSNNNSIDGLDNKNNKTTNHNIASSPFRQNNTEKMFSARSFETDSQDGSDDHLRGSSSQQMLNKFKAMTQEAEAKRKYKLSTYYVLNENKQTDGITKYSKPGVLASHDVTSEGKVQEQRDIVADEKQTLEVYHQRQIKVCCTITNMHNFFLLIFSRIYIFKNLIANFVMLRFA